MGCATDIRGRASARGRCRSDRRHAPPGRADAAVTTTEAVPARTRPRASGTARFAPDRRIAPRGDRLRARLARHDRLPRPEPAPERASTCCATASTSSRSCPNATIYLEAGASDWEPAHRTAEQLRFIGIAQGARVHAQRDPLRLDGGQHPPRPRRSPAASAASRSSSTPRPTAAARCTGAIGAPAARMNVWCHPLKRGLGHPADHGHRVIRKVDAYLWIGRPGFSGRIMQRRAAAGRAPGGRRGRSCSPRYCHGAGSARRAGPRFGLLPARPAFARSRAIRCAREDRWYL